jgi:hypothetical protein
MGAKNKPYSVGNKPRNVNVKLRDLSASSTKQEKRKTVKGAVSAKVKVGRFGVGGSYEGSKRTNIPREGVKTQSRWQRKGLDLTVPVPLTSVDLSLGGTQTTYGSQTDVDRPEFTGTLKQQGKKQYESTVGLSWPVGQSGEMSLKGTKSPEGLTGMFGYKTSFNTGGKVRKRKRKK